MVSASFLVISWWPRFPLCRSCHIVAVSVWSVMVAHLLVDFLSVFACAVHPASVRPTSRVTASGVT